MAKKKKDKGQKKGASKKPQKEKKGAATVDTSENAFPAEVLEVMGKVGTKQGGMQVRVKIMAGRDEGKIMRRNVLGPIKAGDILILRETEIEASPIRGRRGK